ncbi:hypothetical protein GJ744_006003 [Endocarpon pusillum]|uniref:PNPLA domain-containing protein n=1 Tax=Endocarpon pusillum TaxID=364733 RepID=A0A8H7A6N8_9EURO|nr:hypothetical protein GJ744_006003 [Endocarpon pusillum]
MTLAIADPCEGSNCPAQADTPRWLCASCDCTYCDLCWELQAPHRQGKLGQNGLPHEKTSKDVFVRLQSIFEPPEKKSELLRLHLEDEETLWFGVEKDDNGKFIFTDNGRYTSLMTMTKQPTATERYPLLVSFVGQTGAGKSTLIKMLVSLKESNWHQPIDDLFKTPITGSVKDDRSPTSGDVHLYIDPQSAFSDLPMLYADCEGLEGGEVPPRAKTIKNLLNKKPEKPVDGTTRELQVPVDKGQIGVREYAVRNVYPRLLYTFSDVIVFVLKNTRVFESVTLKLLLEWASSSMESSVNQPALPQAIIVLNDSDASMDKEEWDGKTATKRLMDHIKHAIHYEPIKKYADSWAKRGKIIRTSEELIRCYYADVRVVRIPGKGRNMLIKSQIDQLHLELSWACQASFKAKWEARQYCTTEELNRYLQAAFDHFTSKPEQPFNFVDVALKADPIPQSFAEHIMSLASSASNGDEFGYAINGFEMFRKLSHVVASCIMLDCIRYKRPGKPEDLFDQHYALSCFSAIDNYNNKYLRCSFKSKKGKQCINSRLYHEKGHQSESGRIVASGPFMSPVFVEDFHTEWLDMIRNHLVDIEASVREIPTEANMTANNREKVAYELHRQSLMNFFGNDPERIEGYYSCYGCLMEVPQHPLPCGHMLCTSCVQMLGHVTDKNTVTVDFCPFESRVSSNLTPCSIRFKPDFAGIRILSLDGGGMRGIVELESLRAIERVLGKGLPIQAFFDLIVGTSTGGIIALGLGVKQWTVDQCITRFIQLCGKAFTPRELDSVKFLRQVSLLAFRSRYKTKPLRDSLKATFGEDLLYGHVPEDTVVRDNKVCVTTTSGTADCAIAVGNYVRQNEDDHWYKFLRGDNMQVWEAASATSAAPKYFTKFVLEGSPAIEYLDGALYFNNPVRIAFNERRFLWPDVADAPPDIVLSLGTGKDGRVVDSAIKNERLVRTNEKSRTLCLPDGKMAKLRKLGRPGDRKRGVVRNWIEGLSNFLDSILDAEREFRLFEADQSHFGSSDRYIRLNPDLQGQPPPLDEAAQMLPLQEKVQKIFKTPAYELIMERIAYRLVASSFYFAKSPSIEHDKVTRSYECKGRISCRFEGSANDMKASLRHLGEFFRRQSTTTFRPYFTVKGKETDMDVQTIEIDRQTSEDMIADANFHIAENLKISIPDKLSSITIFLCLLPSRASEPELYPISGFPRTLVTEDASTASRLQKRAELIKSKINKSELLVGDSLFDFLDTNSVNVEQAAEPTTALGNNGKTNADAPNGVGSPDIDNASLECVTSPSSSKTSISDYMAFTSAEKAKANVRRIRSRHTSSQQSDPAGTSGAKSPDPDDPKHRVTMSNIVHQSASIADFRSSGSRKQGGYTRSKDIGDDDEALINALQPPPNSPGVEVIDALKLMREQEDALVMSDGSEKGSVNSTKEIRETWKATVVDGDESDSDGPPSIAEV